MHMTMMVTGVPPKHIQQGAEVILGETPAKIVGGRLAQRGGGLTPLLGF